MPGPVCSQAWLARGSIAGSLLSILMLGGCTHDWDAYDPRGGPSAGGAAGAGGAGGAGTSTSTGTTSTTTGVGGGGGMGGGGGGGGGGSPPCGPNGLLSLQDDFEDGMIGAAWTSGQSGAAILSEQGGALQMSLPDPNDAMMYAYIYSVEATDLTGCGLMARVLEVPDPTTDAYGHVSAIAEGFGTVEIIEEGGLLYFKKIIDGMHLYPGMTPFDPIAHAYWRVRESGGTLFWETSPDAQTWTVGAMEPAPIPLTSVHIVIGAGTYQVEPVPPGTFRVSSVNTPP